MNQGRFQDENKTISEFRINVLVVCPKCGKKAFARVEYENKSARLFCESCGYNKVTSTQATVFGDSGNWQLSADSYFGAELWLKASFKSNVFWAYNLSHLEYLEKYISANLREHKGRTHFTLLEKLPKFYHEAKNREALLKIIERLKSLL
ncbi:hypothetical protein [Flavobacterium anhuiense]|uniref:hypothetical protein n=1 Tax=Flavobacterium anhuiense TaxID=459526 RepID=UPI001183020F|nr:hypothetical protein [Flavobacterium anhuiense]